MTDERGLALDPVIAAAIAAHGPDAQETWVHRDGGDQLSLPAERGRPRVSIREGWAMVRWWRAGTGAVHYEVDAAGSRTVSMTDMDVAESVAVVLKGRPLADLVALAGDPGYVIAECGTRRLGEFPSLWARLAMPPSDAQGDAACS